MWKPESKVRLYLIFKSEICFFKNAVLIVAEVPAFERSIGESEMIVGLLIVQVAHEGLDGIAVDVIDMMRVKEALCYELDVAFYDMIVVYHGPLVQLPKRRYLRQMFTLLIAKICPYDAMPDLHFIAADAGSFGDLFISRQRGYQFTFAISAKLPSVIAALDMFAFDIAEREMHIPVAAAILQHTDTAGFGPEYDQLLPYYFFLQYLPCPEFILKANQIPLICDHFTDLCYPLYNKSTHELFLFMHKRQP